MANSSLVATVTQRRLAGQRGETALGKAPSKAYETLIDKGSFIARDSELRSSDPLVFPGYESALTGATARANASESVTAGSATVSGRAVELAFFDFGFLGGSMGGVAGERLARAMERAADERVPFVLLTETGGARMQEGMGSLVQMPKVVVARATLAQARVPFIALLGHPTTGGVLASLGALADVTYAAAGATIGFAGPRIVERFTGSPLREGSHTARSALDHGLVDEVVEAKDMGALLEGTLAVLAPDDPYPVDVPEVVDETAVDGWDAIQAARAADRPTGPDLIYGLCEEAVPLRGDRMGRDDPAVTCVIGRIEGRRAVVIALDRARPPTASAFQKAKRCVKLAGRLDIPIVTLIDTPGADPSEDSDAAGVAWSIAGLFEAMLATPVPVVSIVTGEGGSGGALAFAVGDVLVAYANAVFSVIGPESAAEILWRDSSRAPEAARLLKVSAADLKRLAIADEIAAEPLSVASLKRSVAYHLDRLATAGAQGDGLVAERRRRWRNRD